MGDRGDGRLLGVAAGDVFVFFARAGQPEEGRYVQLRREWKTNLQLRFLFFFEFQALLTVVLSLPFLLAASTRLRRWAGWKRLARGSGW